MKLNKLGILIGLAIVALFPFVVGDVYFHHMAILIGIYAMGAIAVNILLGFSGQLSLGHSAFVGLGAYTSALLYLILKWPFWLCLVGGIVVSSIMGYIVAKISLRLRGAYFVIMTIGVAQVLKLVALNWVSLTKGPMGLTDIGLPSYDLGFLGALDFSNKIIFYYLVAICVLMVFYIQYRLVNSSTGRAIISIRENEDLAECLGINCYKFLVITVIVSAAIAGASGSLYCHYVSFLDPAIFEFFLSVNLVMMVVGGGQGTLTGPIIGAVLFTMIPEWLRVFGAGRMAVYSLIVIAIVVFMPRGINAYITKAWSLVRDRR